MKTFFSKKLAAFFSIALLHHGAFAINWDFLFKGIKTCKNMCMSTEVCELEHDASYRWCKKNCPAIDLHKKCNDIFPTEFRPILPYESDYSGPYATNQVSVGAIKNFDLDFIEQTTDRRRVIGTLKTLLLVKEQVVTGVNMQRAPMTRLALADKLFEDAIKADTKLFSQYELSGTIPDKHLLTMVVEAKEQIMCRLK